MGAGTKRKNGRKPPRAARSPRSGQREATQRQERVRAAAQAPRACVLQ